MRQARPACGCFLRRRQAAGVQAPSGPGSGMPVGLRGPLLRAKGRQRQQQDRQLREAAAGWALT